METREQKLQEQDKSESDRKPYHKPVLQVYGDLLEITRNVAGSKNKDGASHPNQHFTS